MEIAIPLYDRFTALDAVGPYEVLWRVPGARVRWIGAEARPYATDRGLQLVAEATFEDVPSPDVLVVPGGTGTLAALEDRRLVDWIRARRRDLDVDDLGVHRRVAARRGRAARRAAGRRPTGPTSTASRTTARRRPPSASSRRARSITSAGVSSGIDMALTLAAAIAGDDVAQAIQLRIEYDPEPPFDTGSTAKAPAHVIELARSPTPAAA